MLQGTSRAIKIPFLFPNFFFFFFFFLGEDAPSQYVASTQTQAFAMDSQMGMPRLAEDSQAFNFTNESQDPFARKPHGEVMKLGGFSWESIAMGHEEDLDSQAGRIFLTLSWIILFMPRAACLSCVTFFTIEGEWATYK